MNTYIVYYMGLEQPGLHAIVIHVTCDLLSAAIYILLSAGCRLPYYILFNLVHKHHKHFFYLFYLL